MNGSPLDAQGPTLAEILEFVTRGLLPALVVGALLAAAAWSYSSVQQPMFEATSTVLVQGNDAVAPIAGGVAIGTSSMDALGYSTALVSDAVLSIAHHMLQETTTTAAALQAFRDRVSVSSDETRSTTVLRIRYRDPSAEEAAAAANALAFALREWDRSRINRKLVQIEAQLQREMAALDAQLADLAAGSVPPPNPSQEYQDALALRTQLGANLLATRALQDEVAASLDITQPAVPPAEPVSPRPLLASVAAFAIGVLGAYVIYGILVATDTVIRHRRDIEAITGAAPVGGISKRALARWKSEGQTMHVLREAISGRLLHGRDRGSVVLLTSVHRHEEQDRLAAGLAISYAGTGRRTLLIDGDLYEPRIAKEFNMRPTLGPTLSMYLRNPEVVQGARPADETAGRLVVIPSFHPEASPVDLIARGFAECLDAWRGQFDAIVISAPPVLPVADAGILAGLSDCTIMCPRIGATRKADLRDACAALAAAGARNVGTVSIGRTDRRYARSPYGPQRRANEQVGSKRATQFLGPIERQPRPDRVD